MKQTIPAIAALVSAAVFAVQPSHAQEGPWCAYESMGDGYAATRCDLPSYEACRAWIKASPGTWCTQNPRYGGPPQRGRAPRPR